MPSLTDLRAQAIGGDPWAQLNLGAYYDNGQAGAPQCPQRAAYWYRRAAEQGLAFAQFNLGHLFASGTGVKQDYHQARYWFERAARQGDADAAFLLGVIHADGLGIAAQPARARHWFTIADRLGHAEAGARLQILSGEN